MFEFFWNLLSFVVALGILVTAHEYGHFWVARKCGVHVHRFSVGFGKPIWRRTDKYGTEFVVALIPLGGYVKMLDERVEEVAPEQRNQAFNHKPVGQRIAIIAAGPLANFIFAIFAFYLMYLIGVPGVKPIVAETTPNSIAAQSQLPKQAELVEVAGQKVRNWQEVNIALVSQIGEDGFTLKAKQSDSQYVQSYQFNTQNWQFSPESGNAITSLGLVPQSPKVHAQVAQVGKGTPAAKAGLKVGDKLIALNNERVNDNWRWFSDAIKQYPDQQINLLIERNGQQQELLIDIASREGPHTSGQQTNSQGYLGIAPKVDPWPERYRTELSYGPFDALVVASQKTWQLIVFSFDMIGKLITGDISVKNLSGPIAIAQGAGASAGFGIVAFLSFLALISINLGIINLLPLPVLDGGHLMYYFVELLTGKPVPENVQEAGFKIGAILLLTLMSVALFNDISRL